ncbi:MAG: hypothetical protein P3W94_001280 [Paracoccus sp. (in: a-proteobacteria)]|nr:hypothetical protein [Paracoccus sp. (in: a-proteobacteria)]
MSRLLQWIFGRLPIGWRQLTHKRGRFLGALLGVAFANVLVFVALVSGFSFFTGVEASASGPSPLSLSLPPIPTCSHRAPKEACLQKALPSI